MLLLAGVLLAPLGIATLIYGFNSSELRKNFDQFRLLQSGKYKGERSPDYKAGQEARSLCVQRKKDRLKNSYVIGPLRVNQTFAQGYVLYVLAILLLYGLVYLFKAILSHITVATLGIVIGIIVICAIGFLILVANSRSTPARHSSRSKGVTLNKRYVGAFCVIGAMAFFDYTGRYVYDSLTSNLSASPISVVRNTANSWRSYFISLPKSGWRDTGLWVVPGSTISINAKQDAQPFLVRIRDQEFQAKGDASTGFFSLDMDVVGNQQSQRGKPFALISGQEKIFLKLDPQAANQSVALTLDLDSRKEAEIAGITAPSFETQWRNFWLYIPLWMYGAIVVLILTFFIDRQIKNSPKRNDPLGLMKYLE